MKLVRFLCRLLALLVLTHSANCEVIDSIDNLINFVHKVLDKVGFGINTATELQRLLFTGQGDKFNGPSLDILMKSVLPHVDELLVNTLRTARMLRLEENYYKSHNKTNPYFLKGPFRSEFTNNVLRTFQTPDCAGLNQFLGLVTTLTTILSGDRFQGYTSDVSVITDPAQPGRFAKFYFFGPKHRDRPYAVLDYPSIRVKAGEEKIEAGIFNLLKKFMIKRKTFIIVHGWFDRFYKTGWMDKLKDLILLREGSVNVIIVDWHQRSFTAFTNKVAANARFIAVEVSAIITNLIGSRLTNNFEGFPYVDATQREARVPMENIHMIGHSFGGQLVGVAGTYLQKFYAKEYKNDGLQIGNITAIDIADQCFYRGEPETHYSDALTTNSALRVKVIHTNGDFGGTYKKYGHIDVFVDGASTLPGCLLRIDSITNYWQLVLFVVCSHVKIEAISTTFFSTKDNHTENCYPIAYDCPTFGDFLSGLCYECTNAQSYMIAPKYGSCQLTGIDAQFDHVGYEEPVFPRQQGNYSLTTSIAPITKTFYTSLQPQYPYCHYTYRVEVFGEAVPSGEYSTLTLIGRTGTKYTQTVDFDNGAIFLFFVDSNDPHPSPFRGGVLEHYSPLSTKHPFSVLQYYLNITYMSHLDPLVRQRFNQFLCTDYLDFKPQSFQSSNFFPGTSIPIGRPLVTNKVTYFNYDERCKANKDIRDGGRELYSKLVGERILNTYYDTSTCYYNRRTMQRRPSPC